MRLAKLVLLLVGLVLPAPLGAQWWGGCVDNLGRAVRDYPNYGLNDIARATLSPGGAPIIEYNPQVVLSVSTSSRRFFYMHECGHHALGQISSGYYLGMASEQQADCWAAVNLVRSGTFNAVDLRTVQMEVSRSPGDWAHLPGPQRALNLVSCLQQGQATPEVASVPQRSCRTVMEWQNQVVMVTQMVQQTVQCSHCGWTSYGYQCMHPYDVALVPTQVPVSRPVQVPRTVCN